MHDWPSVQVMAVVREAGWAGASSGVAGAVTGLAGWGRATGLAGSGRVTGARSGVVTGGTRSGVVSGGAGLLAASPLLGVALAGLTTPPGCRAREALSWSRSRPVQEGRREGMGEGLGC